MNRRKKINDTLKKKARKAKAHLKVSNKPRYISKAERGKLAENQVDSQTDNLEDTQSGQSEAS